MAPGDGIIWAYNIQYGITPEALQTADGLRGRDHGPIFGYSLAFNPKKRGYLLRKQVRLTRRK
jgi:hypothetical protein